MSKGAELIAKERTRQIDQEGWTIEHDDEHGDGDLAMAACCYAAPVNIFEWRTFANGMAFVDPWPWDVIHDKRYEYGDCREGGVHQGANFVPDPVTYDDGERLDLLVKAGALIAAEIDRLLRKKETSD